MMLWIILAAMTAIAALAVLGPMARARQTNLSAADRDLAVYKDQLAEIDRDLERGVIGIREAEAGRTEISRRILKAARGAAAEAGGGSGRRGRIGAIVAAVGLPAVALGVYLSTGAPDLPDQPLSERLAARPEQADIDNLVARVESHLMQNPEDGRGWEVLAPVYLRLNRPADAAQAFRNAIRTLGASPRRQSGLGEALTVVAGGIVTAEARAAFEAALAPEPGLVAARMYLNLALTQEGRHAEAVAAWQTMIAGAGADAPWLPTARRELAAAEIAAGRPPSGQPAPGGQPAPSGQAGTASTDKAVAAPGPSAEDMAAAAGMAPEDRTRMIEGMVARLSERLDQGGGSVDEWSRLIRSLAVLGRKDEARAAALKAREAVKSSADDLARIDDLSKGLGLAL
ncbi:c-type cytochrome biogenesis protein CcmI [Prosthecodimorpha staleyi]|uniref:C-type cytochrome biogenesis protein CcmI n=1 Tax=Prosthecodimorpha staleyi TaxID=2840188 RepID=A0A947D6N9_9HYPH|nr:c-type cytochrome biogenesis protein CcmI [Prosthecodimorpha staleyi]MBT9289102.1 c-type cytochrome biogenesis protein CcmI [Prosthecodimorpha staleyi]